MFNKELKDIDYKTFTITFTNNYIPSEEKGFFEKIKDTFKKLIMCEWF